MEHSFNVDIAKEYGVYEAIVLRHFQFWIQHNKANETNFYAGRYWTYNSRKAMSEIFPYFSEDQLKRIINKLIADGLLIKGNFNENKMDRRLWYALTDKGLELCPLNSRLHGADSSNALGETAECYIYPSNTIINTDEYTDIKEKDVDKSTSKKKSVGRSYFIPPTVEEVSAYCNERGNGLDPEMFVNFYEAKGWMVGRNKMKNWKAAVRTWERKEITEDGLEVPRWIKDWAEGDD